jgi:two-component system, OmpR family, phosphate regulon sensor histidine kinase PhoR
MRHRLSLFLMVFSLALLGLFLLLFLQKVYREEKEGLKRETGLLFVNAMRGIESAAIDKLLVRTWNSSGRIDSALNVRMHASASSLRDTSIIVFTQKHLEGISAQQQNRKSFHFEKRAEKTEERSSIAGGLSMSMIIKTGQGDSIHLLSERNNILPDLHEKFKTALQKAGIPLHFNIDTSGTTLERPATLLVGRYVDVGSNIVYQAEIQDYRSYLFKKTGVQILVVVLLFAVVALAFLFVYQSLRRQQHLTELKNDFIRNITHELKTPIATVSVAVEAMQNFDALQNPLRSKEYLEISRLELNRLSLLVDKVLRMSQFEKEAFELKMEPLNLKNLVEEILASMKLQFEKYNASVQFNSGASDFSFTGDRLHLASVVYNLLDNALKYSTEKPEIAVSLDQNNGHFTLAVRDKGRGIPEAFRDKIFDKFFRVPTGDVHNVKGHGLGLSYVAGVVRTHGGDIGVESREGAGSTFTIRLPAST